MSKSNVSIVRSPQPISKLIPKLIKPIIQQKGGATAGLLSKWSDIIGEDLSLFTRPGKITYPKRVLGAGTLQIDVDPRVALEVSHMTPILLDRINTYYGYPAVSKIKIISKPFSVKIPAKHSVIIEKKPSETYMQAVSGIEDEHLRQALINLSRWM